MQNVLACFYALLSSLGYCALANIRPRKWMLFFASLGGMLAWAVFLACGFLRNDITQSFCATVVLAFYADIFARLFKTPATVYLIAGLIPLVPGGGIYYTMEHCISGEFMEFLSTGAHAFGVAGALALGILSETAMMRLFRNISVRLRAAEQEKHM